VNNTLSKLVVFAMFAALCVAAGCGKKAEAPKPAPTTAAGQPIVRSNDPSVVNNPNIPESVRRQLNAGAPPGPAAPR